MNHAFLVALLLICTLACGCKSTAIGPIVVPTPAPSTKANSPPPSPASDWSAEAPVANLDDIGIVRLDLNPSDNDDPVRQIRMPTIKLAHATLEDAMTLVARASGVPFQLYSEGLESRSVDVNIAEGMTLKDAISDLCRQANCHYAYYIDQIDRRVVAGVRITRRPFRSYGKGELGRLQVIHS